MKTDQRVYLDEISQFLETTEGLSTNTDGSREFLVGKYALGFKMIKEGFRTYRYTSYPYGVMDANV